MNTTSPVTGPTLMTDLMLQGGGTYAAATLAAVRPENGYAVGIGGVAMLLPEFDDLGASGRAELLRKVAEEYGSNYVGTWHDDDEGIVYVDAVQYYGPDEGREAARMAFAREQKEVFDFAAGRSIRPGQIAFDQ